MPELPEVETIRNDLNKVVLYKKIAGVEADRKLVKSDYNSFLKILKGNGVRNIKRTGKLLIFALDEKNYLLVHLKMTGQLIYASRKKIVAGGHDEPVLGEKLPNKFTRATFKFSDGSMLFFNDVRRFGYMKIVGKEELEKVAEGYGVEPLSKEFTLNRFKKIIEGKKGNIKQLLFNQELIAGIGNIYADEILFEARVRPQRKINTLKELEVKMIFKAVSRVLKKAIKYRGTTFNDYRDAAGRQGNFRSRLRVYGRKGEECGRCGGVIKKIRIGGRGTYYCDKCQR